MIIIVALSSTTKQNTYYSTKYVMALMPLLFLTRMIVEFCLGTLSRIILLKVKRGTTEINSMIFVNRMDSLWFNLITWGLVSRLPWIFITGKQSME